MCYGRLVFAEMPLEIRQYETDTHVGYTGAGSLLHIIGSCEFFQKKGLI